MNGTRGHILLVFLVALAIKLAYVHERLVLPDIDHPVLDSKFHDDWAKGIAFNQWTPDLARIRSEPYFRAPLYPWFLSLVYRTAGTSPRALFCIQAALGAATLAMMFCFCLLVFDRRTAFVAAVIQALYWPFTYHEAERLIPALSLPLDMLMLLLLALTERSGRRRYSLLAGIAAGLSAIARPSILIVIPGVVWWLSRRENGARTALSMLVAMGLVIAPVTVRNFVRGHDLVPIASQGGVNFYIGNNPESDGVRAVVPGTRADWWGGYDDTQRIAQAAAGHTLRASEVSAYWYRRGIDFLVTQPRAALRLYARKLALLIGNAEPSNERQLYHRRTHSRVLTCLVVNFAFVLAAAVLGFWIRRPRSRAEQRGTTLALLLATCYAAGILLFFVTSRFRLPVVLFLVPVAAAGCTHLFDQMRLRSRGRVLEGITMFAAVLLVSLANPFGTGARANARGEYGLGVDHFHRGDYGSSIDALTRSVKADPRYAPAWAMRGRAHQHLSQRDAAVSDLKNACALDSTFADAFYWLGVVYQKKGDHASARQQYLRSAELDSTRVETWTNLADIAFRQKREQEAFALLRRALELDSTYVNAICGMGYYYEMSGNYGAAVAAYERSANLPAARAGLERLKLR